MDSVFSWENSGKNPGGGSTTRRMHALLPPRSAASSLGLYVPGFGGGEVSLGTGLWRGAVMLGVPDLQIYTTHKHTRASHVTFRSTKTGSKLKTNPER